MILSFDLGGTKLRGGLVNPKGQILAESTLRVRQNEGFKGLVQLFADVHSELPEVAFESVSVASAGPLDPIKGVLLDPTNFFTGQKSWGVVPLVKELRKLFRKEVRLENDAAAAVLGEVWKGGLGRKNKNVVAMTLGTGVGIGVVTNGELVRAGRGLHPELSHIPINRDNRAMPCGCGGYGCIEAYLAGTHFTRRLGQKFGKRQTTLDFVNRARDGHKGLLKEFALYGEHLAFAIRSLAVSFAPEVVVLSGGFSHSAELFLPSAKAKLPVLLKRYRDGVDLLPDLRVSKLQDEAALLGATWLASRQSNAGSK